MNASSSAKSAFAGIMFVFCEIWSTWSKLVKVAGKRDMRIVRGGVSSAKHLDRIGLAMY